VTILIMEDVFFYGLGESSVMFRMFFVFNFENLSNVSSVSKNYETTFVGFILSLLLRSYKFWGHLVTKIVGIEKKVAFSIHIL